MNFKGNFQMKAMRISLTCVLALWASSVSAQTTSPVPPGWESMCTHQEDPLILGKYAENTTTPYALINIHCRVTGNNVWHFATLRNWLHGLPNISVFLRTECSNGGKISLPWPMKAQRLVGLSVSNCILMDKYADFKNPEIYSTPDQLRVLEIRDSSWESDESSFSTMKSPDSLSHLTPEYDCGQHSTLEYMATVNVSETIDPVPSRPVEVSRATRPRIKARENYLLAGLFGFLSIVDRQGVSVTQFGVLTHSYMHTVSMGLTMPANLGLTMPAGLGFSTPAASPNKIKMAQLALLKQRPKSNNNYTNEQFQSLLQKLQSLTVQCNYRKLRVLDESHPTMMIAHYFNLMLQNAKYPELIMMNYSRSGLKSIPSELLDFKTNFPKLRHLDLTWNHISEVHLPLNTNSQDGVIVLDLQHNNITSLSLEEVLAWSKIESVFVNITGNPLHCDCRIAPLVNQIKASKSSTQGLSRYEYIRDLECFSPPVLRGKRLSIINIVCKDSN